MNLKLPDDVDPECVALCDVLNKMPGITTTESCCGHGTGNFVVFFVAKELSSLKPLLELLSLGTAWKVEVGYANGSDRIYFILVGPKDLRSGDDFATWIREQLT